MKKLKVITNASAIVTLDGLHVDDVVEQAANLAHLVLEELSIYRQRNVIDEPFECEGEACAFLNLIGD